MLRYNYVSRIMYKNSGPALAQRLWTQAIPENGLVWVGFDEALREKEHCGFFIIPSKMMNISNTVYWEAKFGDR